jgi:hypothetical protein
MTEAIEPGPGPLDRNHVIRVRLPLRDNRSMPVGAGETQSHLSPNLAPIREAIHSPSTVAVEEARRRRIRRLVEELDPEQQERLLHAVRDLRAAAIKVDGA